MELHNIHSHLNSSLTLLLTLGLIMLCSCTDTQSRSSIRPDNERLRSEGFQALKFADFSRAAECGDSLITIATNNPADIGSAIYGRIISGQAYVFIQSRSDQSYPLLSEAERLAIDNGNKKALVSVYNGLGIYMLNHSKDLAEALYYFFEGLDIAKKYSLSDMHALLLTNIAVTYYLRKDPIGLHYAQECYYYGKDNHNDRCTFIGAITSANILNLKNDQTQALRFIREAEMLLHKCGYYNEICDLYCTQADILYAMGDEAGAEELYIKAIDESANLPESRIEGYLKYATLQAGRNKLNEAISLLDSALTITSANGYIIRHTDILKQLSDAYRRLGDTGKALHYSTLYNRETDAIHTDEKEKAITEARIRHDYERTEKAIIRQKIDILQKDRTLNWLITIIIIAVCITAILIILYRRKSRLYSAIVKQTAEAVRNEKMLRETIRDLEQRITPKPVHDILTSDNGDSTASDTQPHSSYIPAEKKNEIISRLDCLMLDADVYTDTDITKDKLARFIGTNRTYLSRVINDHYGMTFTQLINSLRIKEAMRRLSDPADDTPLKAISHQLGFNSMSTFYSQFAIETGMTPAIYREKARQLADRHHNPKEGD